MVTNSFGKRNFIQPMGRPKHALKVPFFFSFYVLEKGGEGGREIFFSWLPNLFTVCSQWVPMILPWCSPILQCFSQHVFHSISLLSQYALEKWCPPFTYIVGQRGGTIYLKMEPFVLGSLHCFSFFEWWANQNWLIAKKIKIENKLGCTSSN